MGLVEAHSARESEAAGARDQAVYADWFSSMHSSLPAADFVSEQTRSECICQEAGRCTETRQVLLGVLRNAKERRALLFA